MSKILVLGASGFIGSHLTSALMQDNRYDVTAIDINNLKLREAAADANYIDLDITIDKDKLSKLIESTDIVVNLVAIANPGIYISDPLRTFELDFVHNLYIVECCARHNKRLIQFSSSEVYGKSPACYVKGKKFFFNEETSNFILGSTQNHRWIYSCSKQLLERVIHAYGLKGKLNYTIIRPFNYIGPRIDFLPSEEEGFPRVFSFFMDALLYNKPMHLVNGGKQQRCYTYIKDATAAHLKIIENKGNFCNCQIFNIGVPENETTIKDLAKTMSKIYKNKFIRKGQGLPKIIDIPGEKFYGKGYDDSDRRLPDVRKIRKLLGWKAKYSLNEMLVETMQYYVDKYNKKAKGQ
jgi:UDP-4-amino-4-deoxy-L-arabinose formyltransferase/UDP-glucuronic acid dehydrogenase (UDP-4-keto-hexauronic acid decarboxylating)